jgi:hypothetical protein
VEDDIETHAQNNKWAQPYILCVTETPTSHGDGAYHMVVDRQTMEVGHNVLRAVETLYKSYFVFNLKYPVKLKPFFNFLDAYVFKYKNVKPTGPMEKYFNKIK